MLQMIIMGMFTLGITSLGLIGLWGAITIKDVWTTPTNRTVATILSACLTGLGTLLLISGFTY